MQCNCYVKAAVGVCVCCICCLGDAKRKKGEKLPTCFCAGHPLGEEGLVSVERNGGCVVDVGLALWK